MRFFIGAFDSSTNALKYCNAGHQPPFVLHKTKSKKESVEMLWPTEAAIGLVEEADLAEKTIELQQKDLLVMYTDGVTEAVNPKNQEFGRDRLAKLSQQLVDDTTIVICRKK
jgi:sigma-B regulation protein RsbU (phosphoserine phosphatase)